MRRIDIDRIKERAQPTRLDRMIETVAPRMAARRAHARWQLAVTDALYGNPGSYYGASRDRRETSEWNTRSGDDDQDLLASVEKARERSLDLFRNMPIARGIIGTKKTNVIGTGLKLKSHINYDFLGITKEQAEEYERLLEAEFYAWAESTYCDISRHTNFYGLQNIAYGMHLLGGDCFALTPLKPDPLGLMPYELTIQLLRAERVCNPDFMPDDEKIVAGLERAADGETLAIHVAPRLPWYIPKKGNNDKWIRYPVRGSSGRINVIHVMRRQFADQTRGEPALMPVIEPLKMISRYTEAELMATVISSMLTVFVKSESGQGFQPMEGLPGVSGSASGGSFTRAEGTRDDGSYKLGHGAILDLAENESVEVVDPSRPNEGFDAFVQAILRQIGMALEIPFEILIKHFTASYSAARAAMLEAWRAFMERRAWFAQCFCQPIYETFVMEGVTNGRINLPGFTAGNAMVRAAWLGAEWRGPGKGQIDELKEAEAAKFRVDNNMSTMAIEVPGLTGNDWEDVAEQRRRELDKYKELNLLPAAPGAVPGAPAPEPSDDDGGDEETEEDETEEEQTDE